MSTKIYNAFRLKDGDLWGMARHIRERGQQAVVARLRRFYENFVFSVDPEDPVYKAALAKDRDRNEAFTRIFMAQEVLKDGFKKSVNSPYRDHFDPEVSVSFTQHATGIYLRAFCDPVSLLGGSLDFLREHPNIEDFHYQNQTDKPKGVAQEDWDARGKIWNEMCDPVGLVRDQLVLSISSHDSYWQFDPWLEIAREYNEKPPVLPIREEVLAQQLRKLEALVAIRAEPGRITGQTTGGASVLIEPAKRRSQKKQWVTKLGGKTKVHADLARAVNWVGYVYMDPSVRGWYDRYRAEDRAKKKLAKRKTAH